MEISPRTRESKAIEWLQKKKLVLSEVSAILLLCGQLRGRERRFQTHQWPFSLNINPPTMYSIEAKRQCSIVVGNMGPEVRETCAQISSLPI